MGTQEPFEGISLVTVGDLFQLKPVFDKWIFESDDENYGPIATNLWQKHFKMYELTQIMRQKEDKKYAKLLNRLREGNHTKDDIAVLKTRIIKNDPENETYPCDGTHLCTTNASVNAYNNAIFEKSSTDKAEVQAIDIIVGDISDELKEKTKKKIPADATKTMGLYAVVFVAVGRKYDLTGNVDVTDGMTNSAECLVQKIDYRVPNSTRPSIKWVTFSD